ncbi:hypothetical protein [Ralstonia insidiosa]|uniref:hypothetical protein n=1 Tax=Ralstonia insidiosa TaxID=190721 RepID=UPI000CEEBC2C|nr:hypothetical protein [Ralstonia insidiosa]
MDEKQTAALRDAFEAAHIGMDLDKHPEHGYYRSKLTQAYWEGWLACCQHLAPQLKDAERYRFLREDDNDEKMLQFSEHARDGRDDVWLLREEKLDSAIDAALALQKEKQQ